MLIGLFLFSFSHLHNTSFSFLTSFSFSPVIDYWSVYWFFWTLYISISFSYFSTFLVFVR